ncbi:MAG: hypothetical protein NTW94_06310, partial [Legionellales bacterium]|nr:hypothetical protein [Legionellales bacterium]
ALALTHLKDSLSQRGPFAPHFRAYFNLVPLALPFVIQDDEPSQVVVIKKIMNALYHVQSAFQTIENMDVREEQYFITIVLKAIPASQTAVHELYAAIQMFDACSDDIQLILGPHMDILKTQVLALSAKLNEFRPTNPSDDLGILLAQGVGTLSIEEVTPELRQEAGLLSLSRQICSLPNRMETLLKQAQLEQEHLSASTEKTAALEKRRQAQTEALQQSFEDLLSASGWFSNKYHFLSLIRMLAKHSSDILSVVIPGTKEGYLKAEILLNTLRHSVIPQVIAEIEHLEETLVLLPGTLSNTLKQQMNSYYTQLATPLLRVPGFVGLLDRSPTESLTAQAGYAIAKRGLQFSPTVGDSLEPIPHLEIMQDEGFEQHLSEQRSMRLKRIQLEIIDLEQLIQQETLFDEQQSRQREAAQAFFVQLKALRWWAHQWQLENILPSIKATLMEHYQQIHQQVKETHPELNAILMMAFDPSKLTPHELVTYSQSKHPNPFQQIMDYQPSVEALFHRVKSLSRQALASATLNKESIIQGAVAQNIRLVSEKKAPLRPSKVCTEEATQALILPPKKTLEAKPLFQRIKELNLSSNIKQFMDSSLLPFLSDSLDPTVFKQLNLTTVVTAFHVLSPEVILYQKLINAMLHLQASLGHLEHMKERGSTYSHLLPSAYHQLRYVLDITQPLMSAVFYAMFYVQEASSNPGLKMVINQALEIIKPLQYLPIVGKKMAEIDHPREDTYDANVNMVELWEDQQNLVKQALSGEPIRRKIATLAKPKATEQQSPQELKEISAITDHTHATTRLDPKDIRKFAEYLYHIPQKLRALNNDEAVPEALTRAQVDAFVEDLARFNWDVGYPNEDSFKVVLNALISINEQLTHGGKEARHLVLHQVENIGRTLVSISNNTEFQIGFKLGELTSNTLSTFNVFYRTLIEQFPVSKCDNPDDTAQDKQALMSDTFMTKTCLQNERARRYVLVANNTHQKIHQILFGQDPLGCFEKLRAMAQSEASYFGFETHQTKLAFLTHYHEIQPFLRQIDLKYDKMLFLRLLRTPEAFVTELKKIMSLEPELHALVEGKKKEKSDKIARCDARIKGLKELAIAESMRSAGLNMRFKHNVFDHCWTTQHCPSLSQEMTHDLGAYASGFLCQLDAIVQSKKQNLIRNISLTRCWVEKISNRQPTGAEKASVVFHYRRGLKNEILMIQNGQSYAIGFCNVQGKYEQKTIDCDAADLGFIRSYQSRSSISKVHADKLNRALISKGSDVMLMHSVKSTIHQRITDLLPMIQQDLDPIKTAYFDLRMSLTAIHDYLKQHEANVHKNAIHHEHIAILSAARERLLSPVLFKEGLTLATVEALHAPIKTLLNQSEHYMLLMKLHSHLDDMKHHVARKEGSAFNTARITEISELQELLKDQSLSVDKRLKVVATRGRSQACHDILQPHPMDTHWLRQAWRWLKHQFIRILTFLGIGTAPHFETLHRFFINTVASVSLPGEEEHKDRVRNGLE